MSKKSIMKKNRQKTKADAPLVSNSEKSQNFWRNFCLALLVLTVIFTALVRIRLLDAPLERDEGEYAYAGQLILKGFFPYEAPSLYKYKMPGVYFIYASILAVFGQSPAAIHFGLLLANMSAAALLFFIINRLLGIAEAALAAVFYLVLSIGMSVQGVFTHGEHFVNVAALGAVLLLMLAIEKYRWWKIMLSGFLFGTAFVVRQHGAAFVLFGGAYFLYSQLRLRPLDVKKVALRVVVFAAGGVLPVIVTFLSLFKAGVLDDFWFWNFVYAGKYLQLMPLSLGMEMLVFKMSMVIKYTVLIWVFSALGILGIFVSKEMKGKRFFLLSFALFSFLAICPGFYFRPHYFIMLLPAIAILASVAVEVVRWLLNRISVKFAIVVAVLMVTTGLLQTVYCQQDYLFKLSPNQVCKKVYGINPFVESLEIADYIKKNSLPSDMVVILGSEPQILFYAERLSPTGYLDVYELMKKHDYAAMMQKEMIREIEAAKPEYMVYCNVPTSWLGSPDSVDLIFEWFSQYQKNYEMVGFVDIVSSEKSIYLWDEDCKGYSAKSSYWIAVLKRKGV